MDSKPLPSFESASDRLPWPVIALWLGAPSLILALAFFLKIGPDRQVLIPWLNIPLPETCAMHSQFGIDCPGCGLTRSFIQIAHGNPRSAIALNPTGLLLFVYVAFQIPLAASYLLAPRYRAYCVEHLGLRRWVLWNEWSLILLVVLLLFQWLFRFFLGDLS